MSKTKSRNLCLSILSKLHLAREKTRVSFNDTLMRAITNFVMFLDVTRPRAFDSDDLQNELPLDILIGFMFQTIEEKSSENGKVMIKDVRNLKLEDCL